MIVTAKKFKAEPERRADGKYFKTYRRGEWIITTVIDDQGERGSAYSVSAILSSQSGEYGHQSDVWLPNLAAARKRRTELVQKLKFRQQQVGGG